MADSKPPLTPPAKKRPRKKFHTRLHRWLGMGSLAIVLIISVTGIALNHTESLKLDERRVTWPFVLNHYGMEPSGSPTIFADGSHLLGVWDGQVILDETAIDFAPEDSPLIGAVKTGDNLWAFVFPRTLLLFSEGGEVFDRLDSATLPPGNILKAGIREGILILETENHQRFLIKDWLEPTADNGPAPQWLTPEKDPAPDQREKLARAFRGEGLALSRILLDLHSGRMFGKLGVILYDLAAISLIVLGITGTMLWIRRR